MNTDEHVRAAVGHLADTAPSPPSWESIRDRLPERAGPPAPKRWPAVLLAVAAAVVALVLVRGATLPNGGDQVELSTDATVSPPMTIPPTSTTAAPARAAVLSGPPQAVLTASSGTVTLAAAGYCWTMAEDAQTGRGSGKCVAGRGDGQTLRVQPGERLSVHLLIDEAPRDLTANVITDIPQPAISQQFLPVDGTNPATILIPSTEPPGPYKLSINGRWSQGSAEYAVIVEVVDGGTIPPEASGVAPGLSPPTTSCVYLSAAQFTCNLGNGRISSSTP